MTHQHHYRTLVEKEYGYIGVCENCKTYNIAYKNFLLCLDEAEMAWFRQQIADKKMMNDFSTSHGKELIHFTPLSNFYLLFSNDEVAELVAMQDEVSLTVEARKMLKNVN